MSQRIGSATPRFLPLLIAAFGTTFLALGVWAPMGFGDPPESAASEPGAPEAALGTIVHEASAIAWDSANSTVEETPRAPILDSASLAISFQALLTDVDGNALPGPTVDLAFMLYREDDTPLGPPVERLDVAIVNGVVDTEVPVDPFNFDGTARFLGVSVNGGAELSPRILMTAVPYALRVDRVESAELTDNVSLGTSADAGSLRVLSGLSSTETVKLTGSSGQVTLRDPASGGLRAIMLPEAGGANFILYDNFGAANLSLRGDGGGSVAVLGGGDVSVQGGDLIAKSSSGTTRSRLSSSILESSNATGALRLRFGTYCLGTCPVDTMRGLAEFYNQSGVLSARFDGDPGDGSSELNLIDGLTTTVALDAEDNAGGGGGILTMTTDTGVQTVEIDSDETDSATLRLRNPMGASTITLDNESDDGASVLLNDGVRTTIDLDAKSGTDQGGEISLYNSLGDKTVRIDADIVDTSAIVLYRTDGTAAIQLSTEYGGVGGDSRVITQVLQITGGSDLSEQFDIRADAEDAEPGTVVCIDADHHGQLIPSRQSYDRTVAGIISGAGGVKPGMLMGQKGSVADGEHPVALTGRVWCKADVSGGAIAPGDLLTTSDTPGHAMKVCDHARAAGAILGKAMSGLSSDRGLVLVLVSLQ